MSRPKRSRLSKKSLTPTSSMAASLIWRFNACLSDLKNTLGKSLQTLREERASQISGRSGACHTPRPEWKKRTPPVLVRFQPVGGKKKWMTACGRLHALSKGSSLQRLYFNGNLTRLYRELFWMAHSHAREMHLKFVWVRDVNVFAKMDKKGRPI